MFSLTVFKLSVSSFVVEHADNLLVTELVAVINVQFNHCYDLTFPFAVSELMP